MEMNFRLIVRYDMTEEVTDQYFATLGDIVTIDENGTDVGEWRILRWIA